MKVLVDTCVWSKTLRHKSPDSEITDKIKELIRDGRIVIIGPIRQELLSGISDISQFNRLKDMLSAFEDITLESKHFIKAAEFSNICRQKGVQGSTIDFLICAVANIENLIIFTTDKDFENYKKYLPIKLL
ncbi:MAG: twitching motility protein PilT [Nitrospinae bacterium RIFCSPLOWO2_01_FULL_39_10]|nr:MAG: twitching motility protein PilT [Nitrospinae bacterium RIFCSPLOWO2_01_FULL_39_10]